MTKRDSKFPDTRWTLVLRSRSKTADGEEAWEQLCESYWYPIYAFLRHSGHGGESAKDLTQGFFEKVIETRLFEAADESRGRLRSFLLGSLKRFLAKKGRYDTAKKRGGSQSPLPLDQAELQYSMEHAHDSSPDILYDRTWASVLLDRVMHRLKESCKSEDAQRDLAVLEPFLSMYSGENYQIAAAKLGVTEGTARGRAFRLRARYREILRDEVAHTIDVRGGSSTVERELEYLKTVFSKR